MSFVSCEDMLHALVAQTRLGRALEGFGVRLHCPVRRRRHLDVLCFAGMPLVKVCCFKTFKASAEGALRNLPADAQRQASAGKSSITVSNSDLSLSGHRRGPAERAECVRVAHEPNQKACCRQLHWMFHSTPSESEMLFSSRVQGSLAAVTSHPR